MYGQGSGTGTPTVLGAATTVTGLAVLPQTGMSSLVNIALAVAAGLLAWGIVYIVHNKFSKSKS
jgi:LPXTG-motif cell wall-anchored protein